MADSAAPKTVLLVDDDRALRQLLCLALERRGFSVLPAADADEALLLFLSNEARIDLVIIDVIMPGTPGPVLARQLQRARADVKVLFISGHRGAVPEEMRGFACVLKPFLVSEFVQCVEGLLQEPHGKPTQPARLKVRAHGA